MARNGIATARVVLGATLLASLLAGIDARAQDRDSAFLACARFDDRAQRIACLEDALDAATATRHESPTNADATPPPRTVPAPPEAVAKQKRPAAKSAQQAVADFGSEQTAARVSRDGDADVLHDTVSALDRRGDLWEVTLSSGQVWRQSYPRRYNLKEGDAVSIVKAGFGGGYELSTAGLSGFIRVKRVK